MRCLSLLLLVLVLAPSLAVAQLTPELREVMLEEHNCARRNKGVPELVWDNGLAKSAQDWANRCTTDHSGMGENLSFACCSVKNPPQFLKSAVKGWLDEGKYWNCRDDTCSPEEGSRCLHFTQAMWEDTTKVGCGWKSGCSGKWSDVVVCQYSPAGNWVRERPFPAEKCSNNFGCAGGGGGDGTADGTVDGEGDGGDGTVDGDGDGDGTADGTVDGEGDGGDGTEDGDGDGGGDGAADGEGDGGGESKSSDGGKIAGAVVGTIGGVSLLGLGAGLAIFFHMRRQKQTMRKGLSADLPKSTLPATSSLAPAAVAISPRSTVPSSPPSMAPAPVSKAAAPPPPLRMGQGPGSSSSAQARPPLSPRSPPPPPQRPGVTTTSATITPPAGQGIPPARPKPYLPPPPARGGARG
ncbi:SCP / Tpx-1 / Ag5 / PR-1 / Sc7 of extracellular domains [Balamuthia mandrillaris]